MTKNELKEMNIEDLIYMLSALMLNTRAYKSTLKSAEQLCSELESRKVIESGADLFAKWKERYEL